MFGGFAASVLGMMTQAQSLDSIGMNIANINTNGYKKHDIEFQTVVSRTMTGNASDMGGVKPITRPQVSLQGEVIGTGRELDIAIFGEGFFVLNTEIDGSGDTYYSRDGSFQTKPGPEITVLADDGVSTITSQEKYLVDKNGYYVQGWAATPGSTDIVTTGTPGAIRIDQYAFSSAGVGTTTAKFIANLPSEEVPGESHVYNMDVYDSGGNAHTLITSFEKTTTNNTWTVTASYQDTPTAQVDTVTIAGTYEAGDQYSVTVGGRTVTYTTTGSEGDLDGVRDAMVAAINADWVMSVDVTASAGATGEIVLTAANAGTGFTSAVATTLGSTTDNTIAVATTTANDDGIVDTTPVTLTFDSLGAISSPAALNNSITWSNGLTTTFAVDISDMTQFAGEFFPQLYSQNGYGTGNLSSIDFDELGNLQGNFTSSLTRPLYQLALGVFINPDNMEQLSGNLFLQTPESGNVTLTTASVNGFATISPQSLELSNVDVAEEFSKMIIAQGAYNASATVFRTLDEMTTTVRDLK